MRNPDGNKDISGDKLEKIERFIEAGNISHLSMEEKKKRELLAKMSPEQKKMLLDRMNKKK